jgi:hypothetical protein
MCLRISQSNDFDITALEHELQVVLATQSGSDESQTQYRFYLRRKGVKV